MQHKCWHTTLPWQCAMYPAEQVDCVAAGHAWQSTDVSGPVRGRYADEDQCVACVTPGPWLPMIWRPSSLHSVQTYPRRCVQGSVRPSPQDRWRTASDYKCRQRHNAAIYFNNTSFTGFTNHLPSSWPHHAETRWTSSVASSPASGLQDGSLLVEVPTWCVIWPSCVFCCSRRRSSSVTFHSITSHTSTTDSGQLLASTVLLSMDHEHRTDYLQHFVQHNLRLRSFKRQLKAHLFQH